MTAPCSIIRVDDAAVPLVRDMLAVFAEAFEDPVAYLGNPPGEAYLRGLLAKEHFIALAAIIDGKVIGALTAYELEKPEQARSEVYVYDLAVAAAHRRRGVATALLTALKPIAAARNAAVIFIQADPPDAPAVALYDKLGRREEVYHFDIDV